MTCPEITMVVRTYQVCALTMFALSQTFRVIVLEHKPYVHLWQSFSETTLYTVRLQLYISCAMIFTLVSIIYPRITMVGQYSESCEHLQTFSELRKWTYHGCALSTRYVEQSKESSFEPKWDCIDVSAQRTRSNPR